MEEKNLNGDRKTSVVKMKRVFEDVALRNGGNVLQS